MAAPPGPGEAAMDEGAPEAEGCSGCSVAALILYQDEICPASYCSLHVHCDEDWGVLLEDKEAAFSEEGPTFHFHRFSFLLMEELPASTEASGADSGRGGPGVAGACGAWVSPLSTRLCTFECDGVGLMESHLAQLRARIEAPGAGWRICARFLHPLLAACYPSLASLTADAPAFALPRQMPLEALACMPEVHQDLEQIAALAAASSGELPSPALEEASQRRSESGGGGGASAAGHTERRANGGSRWGGQSSGGGQAGEEAAHHDQTGASDSLAVGALEGWGNNNNNISKHNDNSHAGNAGHTGEHLADQRGASWAHQQKTAQRLPRLAFPDEAGRPYDRNTTIARPSPSAAEPPAAAPPGWGSLMPVPGPLSENRAVGAGEQKHLVPPASQPHSSAATLQPHPGGAQGAAPKGSLPQLARAESCGESLTGVRSWQPALRRPHLEQQPAPGTAGGTPALSAWDAAALACLTPLLQSPRGGLTPRGSGHSGDASALAIEEMRAVAAMLHSEGLLGDLLEAPGDGAAGTPRGDRQPPQLPLGPPAQQPGDRWARAVQEESQSLLALLSGTTASAGEGHLGGPLGPPGAAPAAVAAPGGGHEGRRGVSAHQQLHEELLFHLRQQQQQQQQQMQLEQAQAQMQAQAQVQRYSGPATGPGGGAPGASATLGRGPAQRQEAHPGEGFPLPPLPPSPLSRWDITNAILSPRTIAAPHTVHTNTNSINHTHIPKYTRGTQHRNPSAVPLQPNQLQGASLNTALASEANLRLLASQQLQLQQQQQQQQLQQQQQQQQQLLSYSPNLSPAARAQEQGPGPIASAGFNGYSYGGPSSPSPSALPPSLQRSPSAGLVKGAAPPQRSLVPAPLPPPAALAAPSSLQSPPPVQGGLAQPPAGSPGSATSSGSGCCVSFTDAGRLRVRAPSEGAPRPRKAPRRARNASEGPGGPERASGGAPPASVPPGLAPEGTAGGPTARALASELGRSAAWEEGGDTLSVGEDTQCLSSSSLRPGPAPGPGGGSLDRLEGVGVEQLRMMFDRNINDAAECLGVGLTVLKKHCRALGILRWPHRKIDSLNKLIQVFEAMTDMAEKTEILRKLEEEKERIAGDPTSALGEHIKTLRQAYFKANYRRRRAGLAAGPPGHPREGEEDLTLSEEEPQLGGGRNQRVPLLPAHAPPNMLSTVS